MVLKYKRWWHLVACMWEAHTCEGSGDACWTGSRVWDNSVVMGRVCMCMPTPPFHQKGSPCRILIHVTTALRTLPYPTMDRGYLDADIYCTVGGSCNRRFRSGWVSYQLSD